MSQQQDVWDVIIVGAGVAGSCAAYYAAQQYKRVLLLEQYEMLHVKGSSHGNSRIIRCTYNDLVYSKMGVQSLPLWQDAEKESKMKVFVTTGGLDFGPIGKNMDKVINVTKQCGLKHTVLKGAEISAKFPILHVPSNYIAVYQEDAGILDADECLRMMQFLAVRNGCKMREHEKVVHFFEVPSSEQQQPLTHVHTEKHNYITRKLILTCGGWTPKVLKMNLDLEVLRQSYGFFRVKPCHYDLWKQFPVYIFWEAETPAHTHYGFPMFEWEGFAKTGVHFAIPEDRYIDPDNRSFDMPEEKLHLSKQFLQQHFPTSFDYESVQVMKQENKAVTCLFTRSPTEDFVIDTHPKMKNVVIFTGCSGHAFKFGTLLGKMLVHLTLDPNCKLMLGEYERSKFALDRVVVSKL